MMFDLILQSFFETLLMIGASLVVGIFFGTPLGITLFMTGPAGLSEQKWLNRFLGLLVNSSRSIPYIILTVLLLPVTRWMTGSSIGTLSAVVPLGFSAILLVARVVEDALKDVPSGLIEAGFSMGASKLQIIRKILIPECLPSLISGITLVLVSLTGFSAMAGAVGGGGLGDLAIRYGYQRFDLKILISVVLILIVLVQLIQITGDRLSFKLRR
jgi:D-methionine transport system permease protein